MSVGSLKLLNVEPVGTEAGDVLIACYDWQSKFASMTKIASIKNFHHFMSDCSKPETLTVKEFVGAPPADGSRQHYSLVFRLARNTGTCGTVS